MSITITNEDVELTGGYSQPLMLAGAYTITVTADKSGDANNRLYKLTPNCQQIDEIVQGAGVILPSVETVTTRRQPRLEDGCYSLNVGTSGNAEVIVTLSR